METRIEGKMAVKVIGANGQISLGKEFAGRQVLVEEQEPGVWLVRTALVIPENELWIHEARAREDLAEALDWAAKHPAAESEPNAVFEELARGKTTTTRRKTRQARP